MKKKSERPYIYRGIVICAKTEGHITYIILKNSSNYYELLESGKTTLLMSNRDYTKVKNYLDEQ